MAISNLATNPDDFVSSQVKGAVKQHIGYDGQNRMATTWVAAANAGQGEKCLRTDYQYMNSTSTLITGMKESVDTWNTAWDL